MRKRFSIPAVFASAALALVGLLAAAAPASAAFGDRVLREGMRGDDVATLQRKLTTLGLETGADGFFGRDTKRSQRRWERRRGRTINGVCSRSDARRIKREVRRQRRAQAEADAPEQSETEPLDPAAPTEPSTTTPQREYGSRAMAYGDSGSDVKRLQQYLTKLGLQTAADGHYGGVTRTNVKRFEAWRYLRANGRVSVKEAGKIRKLANRGAAYVARSHVFPVRGAHSYGGSGSRFGAPRSGHTHQGQDVAASYGTKLVAAHSGKVAWRQYQAGGAGYYLVIHGRDGTDSVYMHMPRHAFVKPGRRVRAGEMIGRVGCTGSCYGAHLHFELWTQHWYAGGHAYDPLPSLRRWDRQT